MGETLFSLAAIEAANRNAGLTWFGAEEKRFFSSRVMGPVIPVEGEQEDEYGTVGSGSLFISSEKPSWGPRAYTVRHCGRDGEHRGHICTVGAGFGAYATLAQARRAQREIAAGWGERESGS
jgi:hypothetical protein